MDNMKDSAVDVLLVGYENQENLGLRSIMAYLLSLGYRVELVPFSPDHYDLVLAAAQNHRPRLVGFSLIFQYTLSEFGKLMQMLRAGNVAAHFTAGGHFPSLRPELTLELLPELDSVVRFEGELTLAELLGQLDQPAQWEQIHNLGFRNGAEVVLTQPRPLIAELDSLPSVTRDEPTEVLPGLKIASMLASRGCLFNCSFCSIRQFYGYSRGPLRRTRSPHLVAEEMYDLASQKGVNYFNFQDDDFAARTPAQREWLHAFLLELDRLGLSNKIGWKISCRVDDLDPETLEAMQAGGLIAVYLGVESGSETGLHALNKHVSVSQNLAAVNLLKRSGLAMGIGFMLLDPSSSVETIRENIQFLRTVGEDGYFPINFCKMLPYAGTPVEDQLIREGRMRGTAEQPDYAFLDERIDWYEVFVKQIFSRRNFNENGIFNILQAIGFNYCLAVRMGLIEQNKEWEQPFRSMVSRSNLLAVETLEALLDQLVTHGIDFLLEEKNTLVDLAEQEWRGEMSVEVELQKMGAGIAIPAGV